MVSLRLPGVLAGALVFVPLAAPRWAQCRAQTTTPSTLQREFTANTARPEPAARPPAAPLSPETRGDIFMALEKYRGAAETYRQGPRGASVLAHKIGTAPTP